MSNLNHLMLNLHAVITNFYAIYVSTSMLSVLICKCFTQCASCLIRRCKQILAGNSYQSYLYIIIINDGYVNILHNNNVHKEQTKTKTRSFLTTCNFCIVTLLLYTDYTLDYDPPVGIFTPLHVVPLWRVQAPIII